LSFFCLNKKISNYIELNFRNYTPSDNEEKIINSALCPKPFMLFSKRLPVLKNLSTGKRRSSKSEEILNNTLDNCSPAPLILIIILQFLKT
jgi:hypothetical protein